MTLDGIIHNARMTAGEFSTDEWIDRLAGALPDLAKAQGPYLREYQEHGNYILSATTPGYVVFSENLGR